jgi:hypothetical protein
MSDEFDFSGIEIKEITVVGPNKVEYTLREANGRTAKEHRNALMSSARFGPDGKCIGLESLASVESKFVASCLWDKQGRNPSFTLVEQWPARIQKKLYEKAKELSDMGEEQPIKEALEYALSLDDSPISFEDLADWISKIEDQDKVKPLKRIFDERDSVKNSQTATATGSL